MTEQSAVEILTHARYYLAYSQIGQLYNREVEIAWDDADAILRQAIGEL